MEIHNTSGYPDGRVRELIEFAYHSVGAGRIGRIGQIRVRSKTHGYFSGHAWYNKRDVVMSIGSSLIFPLKKRHYRRKSCKWPQYGLNDWKECVVNVAAHEFTHLVQFGRGDKRVSEIECEQAAYKAVLEYREKEMKKNVELDSRSGQDKRDEGTRECGQAGACDVQGLAVHSPEGEV